MNDDLDQPQAAARPLPTDDVELCQWVESMNRRVQSAPRFAVSADEKTFSEASAIEMTGGDEIAQAMRKRVLDRLRGLR